MYLRTNTLLVNIVINECYKLKVHTNEELLTEMTHNLQRCKEVFEYVATGNH